MPKWLRMLLLLELGPLDRGILLVIQILSLLFYTALGRRHLLLGQQNSKALLTKGGATSSRLAQWGFEAFNSGLYHR